MKAQPTTLEFSSFVNQPTSKTIAVTGQRLKSDIKVNLSGSDMSAWTS